MPQKINQNTTYIGVWCRNMSDPRCEHSQLIGLFHYAWNRA